MLIEVINLSKNIQVSRPLLELCGRHVIMLQMRSRKLRSSGNLLMMMSRASPSAFLPITEVSSALSRDSLGTSCSWQLDPAIQGVLSFFALTQLVVVVVLEEPEVRDLRYQHLSHSFT